MFLRVDTAGIEWEKVTKKGRGISRRMRCALESGYVVGGARRRLPHKAIRSRPEPSSKEELMATMIARLRPWLFAQLRG